MFYSKLRIRKSKIPLVAIITILISFFSFSKVMAGSISPFSTEETLNPGQTSRHSIIYSNENDFDIFVTPQLYKYMPKTEYILDLEPSEELVIIDTDYIEISANEQKEIEFQVTAPESLELGTYYNLIVFEPRDKEESNEPVIGASGAISHLVKVNISTNILGTQVTDDFDTSLEVVDRGIPFIRPAKIKFTFFNNSEYTLIPKGEIQVVKHSGDREPQYFKINVPRDRVFPKESYEEEFEVDKWFIEDIIFGKTAFIRIENGIDKNQRVEEIIIPGFRNEFLYILATTTVIILLASSLRGDTKPEPEYAE